MTRTSSYPTDALFKGLKSLLTSLPSEEEKGELLQTLRDARNFIAEVEQLVESFPTIESSRGLSEGLARLSLLAGLTDQETRLKRLMGFQSSSATRARSSNGSKGIASRVESLRESLKNVGNDNLINVIEASGEPIAVLSELAASMGLRTSSKERKSNLTQRIANHIVNQRGYRMLRGDSPNSGNSMPNTNL